MSSLWSRFDAWRKIPPSVSTRRKIKLFLTALAVVWIYVSVVLSIVRQQHLSAWDVAGCIVGIATALGYWFDLEKTHEVVLHSVVVVLVMLAVIMCVMFFPAFA
ncbi:hypothetical protein [Rhizobium ruizarguesonis]|jgi:hypothetical protein|uniref:hypothetical protein n=1 Tax=Rhizobium ruizarguesonis TaxID=2081791 RepID=UPI0013D3B971|nr:hypothetical protein [Rhizobium ruizarguesonis]NEH76838.1 hypothetical protein [Rhizobium ruizarguesonis]